MPLISRSLPSLFNGVSQQEAALRLPSQCETQENVFSSITKGLFKRPPSDFIKQFEPFASAYHGSKFFLTSFEGVPYTVVLSNGSVNIWDMDGVKQTVTNNIPGGDAYIYATDPKNQMYGVTVADTIFIVNRTIKPDMLAASPSTQNPSAFVWVKTAVAGETYTVNFGGNTVAYAAVAGNTATFIATQLAGLITGTAGGWLVAQKGPLLKIWLGSAADFLFSVTDTWGDQAMQGIKGAVQKFKDLPPKFWPNLTLEVTGVAEDSNLFDTMYVHWEEGTTTGVWKETIKEGLANDLNPERMPHIIVRETNGTFTLSQGNWGSRTVGDQDTAPEPSFVGRSINDIFFWKNRLGFLAGEYVILSRAGEYFEFFPETVSTVLDSDPIDIASSSPKVSELYYAVPFDETVILFSKEAQFQLNSEGPVSPKSTSLDLATSFKSRLLDRPAAAGNSLFFPTEKGAYTSVKEYFIDSKLLTNDAEELTSHVPTYIPGGVKNIAASEDYNLVAMVTENDPSAIYIYQYYFNGDQRIQSSWSRWDMGDPLVPDTEIDHMDIYGDKIYLYMWRADRGEFHMEAIDIQDTLTDTGVPFRILLDAKATATNLSYDAGNNRTVFDLPYDYNRSWRPIEVIAEAPGTPKGWTRHYAVRLTTRQYYIPNGDFTTYTLRCGRPYDMTYTFSEQYVRDENGVSIVDATVKLRNMLLRYKDSGYFKIEVTPYLRNTYTYEFNGTELGAPSALLGDPNFSSGEFRFPVGTDAKGVNITVTNNTHLQCNFSAAEYEALYHLRSQR